MKVRPPKLEPLGPQSHAQDGPGAAQTEVGMAKKVPSQVGIRFLRDVLRAYSFISRKHAFWKIKPPLTSQIAENKILGPIPLDPHEKVNMDAEKIMSNTWDFEFMVKKTF